MLLIIIMIIIIVVCFSLIFQVSHHKDDILSYIIFLRITPFLPNWFINITSPVIGVPLLPFFLGTFIGLLIHLYFTSYFCSGLCTIIIGYGGMGGTVGEISELYPENTEIDPQLCSDFNQVL